MGVKLGSKILLQSKSRGKNWQVILFNLVLS
nr:MAG TPA: BNR/Asp-box repeat protein [Caudoviricetes sp.]